jgi:hypothetical protein
MKNVLVFLVSTVTVASAFAGTRYCLDAKLTWNSHPSIACPAATKICVKNLNTTEKTAKSLILLDGSNKTLELPFSSYDKENDSDVASHLIYSFYKDGVYASYEVESDKSYPYPTETGTFESLSLSTGKKSNDSSVYSSQQCGYEVIKK